MGQELNNESRHLRLLDVARDEFNQCAAHAAELEGKARTYLTINALMMSVGVLALARGGLPEQLSIPVQLVLGLLLLFLLLALGNSYRHLLNVISVSTFRGVPASGSTIQDYRDRPEAQLVEALTTYYSERAASNATVVGRIVESLRSGVRFSKIGFLIFFLLAMSLVTTQFLTGREAMNCDDSELIGGEGSEDSGAGETGGGGSDSGGDASGSDSSAGGSSDPPPPLEETILEKGGDPPEKR